MFPKIALLLIAAGFAACAEEAPSNAGIGGWADAVYPRMGTAGTVVHLAGDGFGASTGSVTFAGLGAKVLSWAPNAIDVVVPDGIPAGRLTLTTRTADGKRGNVLPYYQRGRDVWIPFEPIGARVGATAVWSGREMIIWGGGESLYPATPTNTGVRYNPAADSWIAMSLDEAPPARMNHTAVWAGDRMLIWGGVQPGKPVDGYPSLISAETGFVYVPHFDAWKPMSAKGAPLAAIGHTSVWTGSEMIVWGGSPSNGSKLGAVTAGRYHPRRDEWRAVSAKDAPVNRSGHSALWTGKEMLVWGGAVDIDHSLEAPAEPLPGARYDPGEDTWRAMPTAGAPTGRTGHAAVWTGSEMIVWGGRSARVDPYFAYAPHTYTETKYSHGESNDGAIYDPAADAWRPMAADGAPEARAGFAFAWTGDRLLIFGGSYAILHTPVYEPDPYYAPPSYRPQMHEPEPYETKVWLRDAYTYDVAAERWTRAKAAAPPRDEAHFVWTGDELLIWGGGGDFGADTTGLRYSPAADTFSTIAPPAPEPRWYQTAVWTGSEMIVIGAGEETWGSPGPDARYDPAADRWSGLPGPEEPMMWGEEPTALWTGSEVVVWGGTAYSGSRRGARFAPATNTWSAMTTATMPVSRFGHAVVWTGAEMVVWGGQHDLTGFPDVFQSGGRYLPAIDQWQSTAVDAYTPSARLHATAVWTGREMIVWGGSSATMAWSITANGDGARYDPGTDSWSPMTTVGAASPRAGHSAVWTGKEMIVWGGGQTEPNLRLADGGSYDPADDAWRALPAKDAPEGRSGHAAIWTGTEMVILGGWAGPVDAMPPVSTIGTNAVFNPQTGQWRKASSPPGTTRLERTSAVWTGREVLAYPGGIYIP